MQIQMSSNRESFKSEALIDNMIGKRSYFAHSQDPIYSDFKQRFGQLEKNNQQSSPNIQQQEQINLSPKNHVKRYGFSNVWRKGSLRIIYIISLFLKTLKMQTESYKFKLITKKIFTIIDDNASDFYFYALKGYFQEQPQIYFFQKIKILVSSLITRFASYIPVIMPDNPFKIIFDVIVLILIILNIFYIPMKLSFGFTSEQGLFSYLLLDFLPTLVFIVEIVLNFNTAYYSEGMMNKNRKNIFQYYIKGDFLWDLIVVIPFLISRFNIPYIEFVLLLRVRRVQKIVENVEDATSIREKFGPIIDLIKLIYFLIFVNHFCACIWHFVGQLQIQENPTKINWIYSLELEDASWQSRYIYSFYWSTITTLTVGYGDATPQNDIERIVTIIVVIICSMVFGYTLSSIQTIFQQLREKNDEFKNNMTQMNSYIKSRNISKPLQLKIRKYFEYFFKNQQVKINYKNINQDTNDQCQQLLELLSFDLKHQVKIDMYWKTIQNCKVLFNTFSESFLINLCQIMKLKKFNPGDEIFKEKNMMTDLLFLLKGEVQILANKQKLRTYHEGYVIGLKNFLVSKPMQVTARSTRFVEIAYIQQEDFKQLLKDYPNDFEKFHQLKDSLLFNRRSKHIIDICPLCLSNHMLMKCPFTFFQPNINKLVSSNNVENQAKNIRSEITREFRIKQNFKRNRQNVQDALIEFCIDQQMLNENEIDQYLEDKLGLYPSNDNVNFNLGQSPQPASAKVNFDLSESDHSNEIKSIKKHKNEDLPVAIPHQHNQNNKRYSLSKRQNNKKLTTSEDKMANLFNKQISRLVSSIHIDEIAILKTPLMMMEIIKIDSIPELETFNNYDCYFPDKNCKIVLQWLNDSNEELQFLNVKQNKKKKYQKRDPIQQSGKNLNQRSQIESMGQI